MAGTAFQEPQLSTWAEEPGSEITRRERPARAGTTLALAELSRTEGHRTSGLGSTRPPAWGALRLPETPPSLSPDTASPRNPAHLSCSADATPGFKASQALLPQGKGAK